MSMGNGIKFASFVFVAFICSGCMEQYFDVKSSQTSTASLTNTPTPTASPAPSTTPTATPTATPKPSVSPTPTATPIVVITPTPTLTPSPTPSPTVACTETCNVTNGVGIQTCGQPSTCTLTKCNTGFVVVNGACVPATSTSNFSCTGYEKLVLDTASNQLKTAAGTIIPAQSVTGSGICYYYPIVVEANPLSGASYLTGTAAQYHDQGVISRDHDVGGNSTTVWHPYTMAHTNLNFAMAGPRILNVTGGSLSGTTFTKTNVQIDNFFLIGVYPQSTTLTTSNLQSYYSAWGTADSTISVGSSSGIAFNPAGIDLTTNSTNTYPDGTKGYYSNAGLVTTSNYSLIPLNAEASGGTASVPEVSITNLIQPNVTTTIDFRGLDCGSARYLSSIYLLVQ